MTRRCHRPRRTLFGSSFLILLLLGTADALAQESWDAVYLGGSKIGHMHTYVEKVTDRGKDYNRVRLDIEMHLQRGEDQSDIKLQYGTIESLDGQVLRLDTRTQAGGRQDIRVRGDVDVANKRMKIIIDAGGRPEHRIVPWTPDVRGPYRAEQSMAHQPMKEHEKRQLKIFMPDLNKVADVLLEARTYEPILLGDGKKRPLLRVDHFTTVDGRRRPELDSRVFVDAEGQILKSEQDVMGGIVYYRTTEEGAKAPGGPIKFDMILQTIVKVDRKLQDPEQTRHVKYRIKLDSSEPAQVFPADARQSIQPEKGTAYAVLDIKTIGPTDGEATPGEVNPEYLKPNALVTSDDVRVRGLAQRVTRGIIDPWEKATKINEWVAKNVTDKNFKTAFAAASEVARDRSGDCTEHSVLTAAMCRAVGVPSRVVIGLVYVDHLGGFGYHMWDEVFVNNRWVAIDPTFNQTTVDAAHIKLTDSSLDGVAPFEAFLPMVGVVGHLTIEPIEIR